MTCILYRYHVPICNVTSLKSTERGVEAGKYLTIDNLRHCARVIVFMIALVVTPLYSTTLIGVWLMPPYTASLIVSLVDVLVCHVFRPVAC